MPKPAKNSLTGTGTFSTAMNRFLSHASKMLSMSLDYRDTLAQLGSLIVPSMADWFVIDVLEQDGSIQLLTINHVDPAKVKWARELRRKQPVDLASPTGVPNVIRTGKSEWYPDVSEEIIAAAAQNKKQLELIRKIGFRSVMIVPLIARGRTIGAITFVTTTESGRNYDTKDLELAEEFASRAALALDNAILFKETQDELAIRRTMEERLEMSQRAAHIGSFEWDIKTDYLYWSPEMEMLYGLKPGEFKHHYRDWERLVHPEDLPRMNKFLRTQKGPGEDEYEFRVVWPDHSVHWIYSRSKTYSDAKGKPVRMAGINMDITERKRLEKQKDEFLSIASHELKTPITSIKAFVQILRKYFRDSVTDKSTDYLSKMDNQVDKLTKLVHDLLDVSKLQTGKLEYNEDVFIFDDLVAEVVDEMRPIAGSHEIIHEGDARIQVLADKYRIGQVLTNFLSNAIKYSPGRKKIIVRTNFSDNTVTVSVTDFGIGIPKETQDKIFERFYRVEDKKRQSFPGLGLGLYISSEIVRRQHGRMWVESTEGKGSTFYFSLPVNLYSGDTNSMQ